MELENKIFVAELVLTYGNLLTKKQLNAVKCYYLFDLGLTEIAETENISRQGAYDLVTKSTNMLYDYEEKLGFVKLKSQLKQSLDELKSEVKSDKIEKIKTILE